MAFLIHANGDVTRQVTPADPAERFSLIELYALLASTHDRDGQPLEGHALEMTIEIVSLRDGRLMVIDENGKLKLLAINDHATALARGAIGPDDAIVGPALVCEGDEIL